VSQLGVIGGDSLDISTVGPEGEAQELFTIPLVELRDTHERLQPSYAG
jgi:hypothetical protein